MPGRKRCGFFWRSGGALTGVLGVAGGVELCLFCRPLLLSTSEKNQNILYQTTKEKVGRDLKDKGRIY